MKLMAGIWSYHEWGGWPRCPLGVGTSPAHWGGDGCSRCRVLLLVPSTKVGVDGQGCVTTGVTKALTGACDRTWSWLEFAEGCMTGLGTRGCQGVWLDSELDRVCQVVRSLKTEDQRLKAKDGILSAWFGVFVSVVTRVLQDITLPIYVKNYWKSCTTCSHTEPMHHKPYGLLKQLLIPEKPWNSISWIS